MRFKQFLIEQPEDIVRTTGDLILHECQPYLNQIDYNLNQYALYRGASYNKENNVPGTLLTNHTLKQRKGPKDTDHGKHITFDDMFNHVFGIRFRSNAIFATGDSHAATHYGHPHLLLPKGDFQFLWSPEIDDLYGFDLPTLIQRLMGDTPVFTDEEKSQTGKMTRKYMSGQLSQQQVDRMFTKMVKKLKYRTTNLKGAIDLENEIMISCQSFYMLPMPDDIKYADQLAEYIKDQRTRK